MKKLIVSLVMAVSLVVAKAAPRKNVVEFDNSACPFTTVQIPTGSFYVQVQSLDGTWHTIGTVAGKRDEYVRVYCTDAETVRYRLVRVWALKNRLVK